MDVERGCSVAPLRPLEQHSWSQRMLRRMQLFRQYTILGLNWRVRLLHGLSGHTLKWGDENDERTLLEGHQGGFDLAVAAEVFYICRGEDSTIEEKAVILIECVGRLLRPHECGSSKPAVLLVVYRPRYPDMGPSIRRAAERVGWAMAPIDQAHVFASAPESGDFASGSGRLLAFARYQHDLEKFFRDTGLKVADSTDALDVKDGRNGREFLCRSCRVGG